MKTISKIIIIFGKYAVSKTIIQIVFSFPIYIANIGSLFIRQPIILNYKRKAFKLDFGIFYRKSFFFKFDYYLKN